MNSATVCLGARRYWADGVKVETVRKCMSVSSWSGESVSEASWQRWHSPTRSCAGRLSVCPVWPRQIRVRFVVAIFSIYI